MRADTQNTYKTVSQTTKTCKTQKSTHTPQTMEHGKKKDARVHYTVLTQHTHTTTTTHNAHDHSRAGQQDNHNHTHVQLLCAAPDTQQHANTLKKHLFAEKRLRHPVCYAGTPRPAGYASTRNLKILFQWQSHTRRLNHQHTHNRGHNNTSSLERR